MLLLTLLVLTPLIYAESPLKGMTETGRRVAAWRPDHLENPEELGDRIEGDIDEPRISISLKNGLVNTRYYWPRAVVPFIISGSFSNKELAMINKTFRAYHNNTCVRFRPKQEKDTDYVEVRNDPDGCYSKLGKRGGRQVLNLQSPGCVYSLGTPIHEFMHALGFLHEHSRTDRDDYVIIYHENIIKGEEGNFRKYTKQFAKTFGFTYDYGSVMHYSRYAFSIARRKPTIVPKEPNVKIGQRLFFSESDIKKINVMYRCRHQ